MGKGKDKECAGHCCSDDNCPCCSSKENIAVVVMTIAALFLMFTNFDYSWRVGSGTQTLESHWFFPGFTTRRYGILHVRGTYTQSWAQLSQKVCQFRDLMGYASVGQIAVDVVRTNVENATGVGDGKSNCVGNEACDYGFFTHMQVRCDEYQKMYRISNVVLGLTFLNVMICITACLVVALSKREKTGGVVFGLFLCAGIFAFGINVIWALVTHNSFSTLGETAWYPYPPLGHSWYLNFVSALVLLVTDGIFGRLVLPRVMKFDPAKAKLDKYIVKRERRQKMREKMVMMGVYPQMQSQMQAAPTPYEAAPTAYIQPPIYGNTPQYCGPDSAVSTAYNETPMMSQQSFSTGGLQSQGDFGIDAKRDQGANLLGTYQSAAQSGSPGTSQMAYQSAAREDFGISAPGGAQQAYLVSASGAQGSYVIPASGAGVVTYEVQGSGGGSLAAGGGGVVKQASVGGSPAGGGGVFVTYEVQGTGGGHISGDGQGAYVVPTGGGSSGGSITGGGGFPGDMNRWSGPAGVDAPGNYNPIDGASMDPPAFAAAIQLEQANRDPNYRVNPAMAPAW